jgi:hypothetical protein
MKRAHSGPSLRLYSPRANSHRHLSGLVKFLTVLVLGGCATIVADKHPQLYPNEKLARTSSIQAQTDVDRCMSLADSYIKDPNKYGEVAKQGLIGGAVGAGAGAVGGAIMGEAGRGTGAGAAVGGIIGVLKGLSEMNERSPSYQRFVEHCLQKQGYEIIGWGG